MKSGWGLAHEGKGTGEGLKKVSIVQEEYTDESKCHLKPVTSSDQYTLINLNKNKSMKIKMSRFININAVAKYP